MKEHYLSNILKTRLLSIQHETSEEASNKTGCLKDTSKTQTQSMFHCTNKTCLDFLNAEVTSHPILNSKPNFKKSCHTYREAWKVKCHTQVYFLWPWQALQRSDHVCHWVQFWIYCFILFIPVHRIKFPRGFSCMQPFILLCKSSKMLIMPCAASNWLQILF